MSARSVAELLPRPFSELTLDDVAEVLARVGEERESLFFERKARVSAASLAKSCAAFANTAGGLLVVGVGDDSDELVGTEGVGGEAQLWVKDVLRGHLLPLPPFRARRLPVSEGRALLLVLVEASSTTPHLLTRNGAIYVRNPGSSDPVPIQDQRQLLELLARGERSRDAAAREATRIAAEAPLVIPHVDAEYFPITLALVPTGVAAWFHADLLERADSIQRLTAALGDDPAASDQHFRPLWEQDAVAVVRLVRGQFEARADRLRAVKVWRTGALMLHRAMLSEPEYPSDIALRSDRLLEQLKDDFDAGRNLLLDLGAHGDLRFGYRIGAGRPLIWAAHHRELEQPIQVEEWTTLDLDEATEDALLDRVVAAIGRAMGIGPSE